MKNKKSGSMLLWLTFVVMLGCLLMIIYSIYSMSSDQLTAGEKRKPKIYREEHSSSSLSFGAGVKSSVPAHKSPEEQAEEAQEAQVEEAQVRETMEAGIQ